MTDDEIPKLTTKDINDLELQQIDWSTINTTQWNTHTLYPYSLASLTSTQIQNLGIGTTGSMASPNLTFDLGKLAHKDFENTIPSLYKINEMREMFPGFKKAWDHMRTIYDLVNEEYIERKRAR